MPQIFHRSTNTISRLTIFGFVFVLAIFGWVLYELGSSSYATEAFVPREQPVPFSHKHHVKDDGIDCRYCHTSVETSAFAGLPPTKTCMNCHRQIWADSPMLEPVRESFRTGKPLKWTRVHDLPDFVYFNHSIHVNKGVGCSTCHGRVDEMPLTWEVATLQMQWCLDCHRNPAPYLRPPPSLNGYNPVFDMTWEPGPDQEKTGPELMKKYNIQSTAVLTSCDTCHR